MAHRHDIPSGHYLGEWRKKVGISQAELSRQSGVAKSMISRYETGDRRIHLGVFFALAATLKIAPWQLLRDPAEPTVDALIADKTDEGRRRLVNLVERLIKDGFVE